MLCACNVSLWYVAGRWPVMGRLEHGFDTLCSCLKRCEGKAMVLMVGTVIVSCTGQENAPARHVSQQKQVLMLL